MAPKLSKKGLPARRSDAGRVKAIPTKPAARAELPRGARPPPGSLNTDAREAGKVRKEEALDPKARGGRKKDYAQLAGVADDEPGADDAEDEDYQASSSRRGPKGKGRSSPPRKRRISRRCRSSCRGAAARSPCGRGLPR
jgi:hypothetical protein